MSSFFRKIFGVRYLIVEYHRLITCGLGNEVLLIRVLVHGKSMVRVFEQKLGIFMKKFFKKSSKHDKICYYSTY